MTFNGLEMIALAKLAMLVSGVDGDVDESEVTVLMTELGRFGVTRDEAEVILKETRNMEPGEAATIISRIDSERKRYACSYLGAMIAIDGRIDDREMALWGVLSRLCGFPKMTINDALSYMAEM